MISTYDAVDLSAFLKRIRKATLSFVTSVCPSSVRSERMVVFVTKVTVAVVVAVIFNFSAMVATLTKAAIDFLVTVVTLVTKVTKVSMVIFDIMITKAISPRW